MPYADPEKRRAHQSAYSRAYRQHQQPKVRATQARQWNKYRAAALDALGGCCMECGNDDPRVLEIDHADGSGGQDRKRRSKVSILRSVVTNHSDYQLLCANCHRIKTIVNGEHLRRSAIVGSLQD